MSNQDFVTDEIEHQEDVYIDLDDDTNNLESEIKQWAPHLSWEILSEKYYLFMKISYCMSFIEYIF